jgi:hypothetical protein
MFLLDGPFLLRNQCAEVLEEELLSFPLKVLIHYLQVVTLNGFLIWVHEPLLNEFDSLRGLHVHKPRYIVKNEGVDCLTDSSGDILVLLKLET